MIYMYIYYTYVHIVACIYIYSNGIVKSSSLKNQLHQLDSNDILSIVLPKASYSNHNVIYNL